MHPRLRFTSARDSRARLQIHFTRDLRAIHVPYMYSKYTEVWYWALFDGVCRDEVAQYFLVPRNPPLLARCPQAPGRLR
jgi:hypothetical protein